MSGPAGGINVSALVRVLFDLDLFRWDGGGGGGSRLHWRALLPPPRRGPQSSGQNPPLDESYERQMVVGIQLEIVSRYGVKGTVQRILRGVKTRLVRSMLVNWRPARFFLNFKGTPSQEEHKTIFSGFKISEIALSNQIDFLAQCHL